VSDDPTWLITTRDGCELLVHVRPGVSGRAGVAGLHGDALCVRVQARPVAGAANEEILRVLASALGVPRGVLTLRRGAHGRTKRIGVRGVAAETVRTRLAPFLSIDTGEGRG
jgi:uncharacterized protein YggU (UPF0235/DUF167 family)